MTAAGLPQKVLKCVASLESADSGALVAAFDKDGFYVYASANHLEAVGYSDDELLKIHLSEIVDKSYHHAAWVLRTVSVFYANPIRFSTRIVAKSGDLVQIAGTLRHIREPREPMYFVTCTKVVL